MATGKLTDGRRGRTKEPSASYLRLIRRFPLRPIQSEAQLERAITVIDELLDRDGLDPAEQDYLEVLGDQVARYEDEAHPIDAAGLTDVELGQVEKGLRTVPSMAVPVLLSGSRSTSATTLAKGCRSPCRCGPQSW